MASTSPSPKLGKTTALNKAQSTLTRLSALIPSLTTDLSPVTVYQPGASIGNELNAPTAALPNIAGFYGVWIAPDLNGDGSDYYIQVECIGGGGGAGGGSTTSGGGGGGGGEYACEDQYPVTPGNSYAYVVGLPGSGGFNNNNSGAEDFSPGASGTAGGTTIFDIAGLGLAGGVVANGGQGGDQNAVGIGGQGGTGSANSIHFNGGAGGTNNSINGSDNPLGLIQATGLFQNNTLDTTKITAWYIMNDSTFTAETRNDATLQGRTAAITNFTSGGFGTCETSPAAPAQVPAFTSPAGTYGPNPTKLDWASKFKNNGVGSLSGRLQCPSFGFSGKFTTISAWIQPDVNSGAPIWTNPASNNYGVIAANATGYSISGINHNAGEALFIYNAGTPSAPAWFLYFYAGNGTASHLINVNLRAVLNTWYSIQATFNNGTMTLYVNGSSVASGSAGFTTIPQSNLPMAIGLDPSSNISQLFAAISNVWFATDSITATGVSQAFGLTPPTAGAGGGASGGPSAAGGMGQSGSGAVAGAGGTGATQPASLASTTTAAQSGFAGANAGLGNSAPLTPSGGPYGGGGGGSGDMPSAPAMTVLTIPFTTAATYSGTDAINGNADQLYNVNLQNRPGGNVNSVLYAGGLANDSASGSKNSMLLLPKGIAAQLGNGTIYTISQVFLTFTNAFPDNTGDSLLEFGYSSDTVLPQTYNGSSLIEYVGAALIESGAGTITYDLTQSDLPTFLANGTATAFILGPGSAPSFDAYNAPTGPQFYASIYGPGAYDTYGNPQFPYLTVVLQKTLTTQQGSAGSEGAIQITSINNTGTPVAAMEPFDIIDPGGNEFAEGFTGPITAFDPATLTSPPLKPEQPHNTVGINSFVTNPTGFPGMQYWMGPDKMVHISGCFQNPSSGGPTATNFFVLPSAYAPVHTRMFLVASQTGSTSPEHVSVQIDNAGNMSMRNIPAGTTVAANTVWFIEAYYPSSQIPNVH